MRPFPGTTPSPVLFNGELYVWYTNINLEIWGTRAEKAGGKWTEVFPIWGAITGDKKQIAPPTSINTVVYKGLLYFFWVFSPGYEAVNRLQYATYDGRGAWSKAKYVDAANLGVKPGTSASVNVFKDVLYVFYDGSGDDGTWVTTFSGDKWSPVKSIAAALGWFGSVDFTDPDSWTSSDGKTQSVSNGSFLGSWVGTTTDGTSWNQPINIARTIGQQGISVGSSARGQAFLNRSYLFWNGIGEAGLWYTRETAAPKLITNVAETAKDPSMIDLPYAGLPYPAPEQTLFRPYSDMDEKMAFDLPVSEAVPHLNDRVRAKGFLPTVREVERYGWAGAFLRKYLGLAGKTLLVLIALILMTLTWHYVSPACAHKH